MAVRLLAAGTARRLVLIVPPLPLSRRTTRRARLRSFPCPSPLALVVSTRSRSLSACAVVSSALQDHFTWLGPFSRRNAARFRRWATLGARASRDARHGQCLECASQGAPSPRPHGNRHAPPASGCVKESTTPLEAREERPQSVSGARRGAAGWCRQPSGGAVPRAPLPRPRRPGGVIFCEISRSFAWSSCRFAFSCSSSIAPQCGRRLHPVILS